METSTATPTRPGTRWRIDPSHTLVEFSVRHMAVATVKGRLRVASGTIDFDEVAPAHSRVEVTIDATTVDTHQPQRDADLRSPDFFDVDAYPTIGFRSSAVEADGADRARILGQLTLRGVTRPVALDARLTGRARRQDGLDGIGLEARTAISRREFGLGWSAVLETGGLVVGDEVKVELHVEAVRDE